MTTRDAVRPPGRRGEIDGVRIHALRRIADERGSVMHMLRADAPHFGGFGEIYFATAWPGVVKGWHLHQVQAQNYCVVDGMAKLVLYDDRADSPTRGVVQEIFLGDDNYVLVHIPPLVLNGWKAIGTTRTLLANCATLPHDPAEMSRLDPFDPAVPYDWALIHR